MLIRGALLVAGTATAALSVAGMVVSDVLAGVTGRRAKADRWERWEARLSATE